MANENSTFEISITETLLPNDGVCEEDQYTCLENSQKGSSNVCLQSESSVFGPIANLCSATLGAGVLALPFAMSSAGICFGILLLILAAASTILSIDMLVQSCAKLNLNSYEKLTVALFGNYMGWIVEGCILTFCFGVCVAYIVAVGDILEQGVLGNLQNYQLPAFVTREFVMILFWAFVMFPLSLFEKINALRFASLFGVSSIFFLVFAVSYHSISSLSDHKHSALETYASDTPEGSAIKYWPDSFVDVLRACPIILFAFNCQINVPAILDELVHPSPPAQMKGITRGSIRICFFLYVVMGTLAYIEFRGKTQDNILKNYCVQVTHDPLMIMAFCSITLSVVLAFPLNIFPSRITLDIMITRSFEQIFSQKNTLSPHDLLEDPLISAHEEDSNSQSITNAPQQQQSIQRKVKHFVLTLVISGLALIVAIIVPDISVVFGLLGGFASSLTGLIMPAAFFLKLGLAEGNTRKKLKAWTLVVGGAIIGLLSTGVTIESMFHVQDKQDVCTNMSVY